MLQRNQFCKYILMIYALKMNAYNIKSSWWSRSYFYYFYHFSLLLELGDWHKVMPQSADMKTQLW